MKVLRGLEIRPDKVITAQRRDMVEIDKTKRTTAIIDVAVSLDWKVKDKDDHEILGPQNKNTETMEDKSESYTNHGGITERNFH